MNNGFVCLYINPRFPAAPFSGAKPTRAGSMKAHIFIAFLTVSGEFNVMPWILDKCGMNSNGSVWYLNSAINKKATETPMSSNYLGSNNALPPIGFK
jgi:hypothetical protein